MSVVQETAVILHVRPVASEPFIHVIDAVPCIVGNGPEAHVKVADPKVGPQHLRINVRDGHVTVSDIDSQLDSFLNGNLFSTSVLRDGDRLIIGKSEILVRIELVDRVVAEAPPVPPPIENPLDGIHLYRFGDAVNGESHTAREPFWEPPAEPSKVAGFAARRRREPMLLRDRVYGVIDAAQDIDFVADLKARGYQLTSLFVGPDAWQLLGVAPYLFVANPNAEALADWDQRFAASIGVLIVSSAPVEQVFAHLRSIFIVQDESGGEFFFRFYDPRVLKTYLPTCTNDELSTVFGPIDAFIAASSRGVGYRFFSRGEDGSLSVMKIGRMVLKD